ncbi:LysR family transcriptional regulator [Colwellia sp. MEBiC06753]
MDIRVFKTFIAVAENRHFGKAAEQLYITQAAVSARIKQLEDFYQAKLLVRDKNNLKLTPAGDALLTYAHLIIDQVNESKQQVSVASQQKTAFNIAATPNIWDAYFNQRLDDLTPLFDHSILATEISVREVIQRKLDDRSLDIGLLADPIKEDDFINELIGYFNIVLVGTEPTIDANSDGYIFVDWGISFAKEHALAHKVTPTIKTSTASIAYELINKRKGLAYLPQELVAKEIAKQKLFIIDSAMAVKRPIYLVYKKNNNHSELIQELIKVLSSN